MPSPHPRHARRPSGFTLIELLTVIAIIGILAAILIPVVGTVRASARAANCVSNQRQIVSALVLHATENRGLLPVTNTTNPDNTTVPWSRNDTFIAYLPKRGGNNFEHIIFVCPSVSRADGLSGSGLRETYNSSAALNGLGGTSESTPRQLSTITQPSRTPLLIEGKILSPAHVMSGYFARWNVVSVDLNKSPSQTTRLDYPHRDRMNVTMADASVRSWTVQDFAAHVDEPTWRGVR